MAFLFETRTLGSIDSTVTSEATTTTTLPLASTSPTLAALLASTLEKTTLAPVILSTVSAFTITEDPRISTMTYEDSTFARNLETFNESPESLGLQNVMLTNNTNAAISITQQSKMEANIETLNVNLNHLFLLINGSLVILMQVYVRQ